MVRAYRHVLSSPTEKIKGVTYNVGFENHTVNDLAQLVKNKLDLTFQLQQHLQM